MIRFLAKVGIIKDAVELKCNEGSTKISRAWICKKDNSIRCFLAPYRKADEIILLRNNETSHTDGINITKHWMWYPPKKDGKTLLENCPFCGFCPNYKPDKNQVVCDFCGASGPTNVKDTEKAWNQRTKRTKVAKRLRFTKLQKGGKS